jgi:hypothetical protein
MLRPKTSLAAENLFLRKQLAFYQERKLKPRRADNPTRVVRENLWRDLGSVCDESVFVVQSVQNRARAELISPQGPVRRVYSSLVRSLRKDIRVAVVCDLARGRFRLIAADRCRFSDRFRVCFRWNFQ